MIKLKVNTTADIIIMLLKNPKRCFTTVNHISFTKVTLKSLVFTPYKQIKLNQKYHTKY